MTRPGPWARLVLLAALFAVGCSKKEYKAPPISADEAGRQALADYDKNKDGQLDAQELERCPALKGSLKEIDRNSDGKLSAEEITERVKAHQNSNTGRMNVSCEVTLNGSPVEGATVRLVPERFLGDAIKPSSGKSDSNGNVSFTGEGDSEMGVACGFYRIEVSKKDASGKETIAARYNGETTLGQEVSPLMRGGLSLRLK